MLKFSIFLVAVFTGSAIAQNYAPEANGNTFDLDKKHDICTKHLVRVAKGVVGYDGDWADRCSGIESEYRVLNDSRRKALDYENAETDATEHSLLRGLK